MDIAAIKTEMNEAAHGAATKFFLERLGGVDRYACGFAWITVDPEHKGNTRLGKDERAVLEQLGFSKDWTGKAYQLWNPSRMHVQNVDTLEVGAQAGAAVLKRHGFNAYHGSRLD